MIEYIDYPTATQRREAASAINQKWEQLVRSALDPITFENGEETNWYITFLNGDVFGSYLIATPTVYVGPVAYEDDSRSLIVSAHPVDEEMIAENPSSVEKLRQLPKEKFLIDTDWNVECELDVSPEDPAEVFVLDTNSDAYTWWCVDTRNIPEADRPAAIVAFINKVAKPETK